MGRHPRSQLHNILIRAQSSHEATSSRRPRLGAAWISSEVIVAGKCLSTASVYSKRARVSIGAFGLFNASWPGLRWSSKHCSHDLVRVPFLEKVGNERCGCMANQLGNPLQACKSKF